MLLTNEKEHPKCNFCWRKKGKSRDTHSQRASLHLCPCFWLRRKNTSTAPNALSALCAYHCYKNAISFSSVNLLEMLNKDAHCQSKKLWSYLKRNKSNTENKTRTMRIVAFGKLLAEKVSQEDVPSVFSSRISMMS